MTAQELAKQITGMEYPFRLSQDIVTQAKAAGLVIVYGASDDLMEFEGAINDEIGAYDGGTAFVTAEGLLADYEQIDKDDKNALRYYFQHEQTGVEIESLWCKGDSYSWTFKTTIPHETFEIVDDGEPYCRGIVFALADVPTPA